MLDQLLTSLPYKMVFVSSMSLLTYTSLILFIRFIYPKKNIPYPILLLGLAILPTISIFREGTYESGDINIHITRLMSFYQSLSEGILIPRWAGELNATYGYALFEFIYPLPYFISSIYHLIGFSFLDSIKLLLISAYLASGFTMYFWLRQHVSEKSAFLGSIFYLFAPYHLVDMHFRANIGEMLALVFIPLCLFMVDNYIKQRNKLNFFLLGASFALLLLSHPGLSILGLGLITVYLIFLQRKVPLINIFTSFLPIILGLLFSAFYWIPANLENKYILADVKTGSLEFLSFSELLYSKWRYGLLFQGPFGELSFLLGYAHWITIFIACYILIYRKSKKEKLLFFMVIFLIYTFLLLENSKVIWENVSLLRSMRITHRVLAVVILLSSAIASFVFEEINNKKLFLFLLTITIGTTILNWGNRKNLPNIKDKELAEELPYSKRRDGCWALLISTEETEDRCQANIPLHHIESLDGKLVIINEKRTTTNHKYIVEMKGVGLIKENTSYFPGWKLYINGSEKEIIYNNKQYPGVIMFYVQNGKNHIELSFEDTGIRKYSFYISTLTLISSGAFLIYSGLIPKKKNIQLTKQ